MNQKNIKMGIKHLNKFIKENCSTTATRKIALNQLKNKTVVIDTSIYLYKFIAENALIENMYLFISILRKNDVKPVFIFDGKPPAEKNNLLRQRHLQKKDAETKYFELKKMITDSSLNSILLEDEERAKILNDMDALKRQFIRVKDNDILRVKQLFDAYGVCYYDAPGEADQLCVYLVKTGKAWGCLSDDMDMFLYGCPYVIRQVSLLKQSAIFYDTTAIIKELNLTERQFCEIMVLSGTDYNINGNTSLTQTLKWFVQYNKHRSHCIELGRPFDDFYIWVFKNTKYITDFNHLLRTYKLFQLNGYEELDSWKDIVFPNKTVDLSKLKEIMRDEGFVFVE
jgi:flap endonuclease-1